MTISTILKTSGIIKASPDETLGQVLKRLSSSYDAAFVFNEKGKYLGIISPYRVAIQKKYPPTTKVKKCITHAPQLLSTHTIEHAAAMMVESRIHYLPVFHDKKFLGIVTAHRILQATHGWSQLKVPVIQLFGNKKAPHVVYEKDAITKALHIFQKAKITKLIVIKGNNRLAGILSCYDILDYLEDPQTRMQVGSKAGEKKDKYAKLVSHFYKTKVLTVKPDRMIADCASLIVKENIGSIIVVDPENHPLGLITTDDIFSLLVPKGGSDIVGHMYHNLNAHSRTLVDSFMERTLKPLSQRAGIESIIFRVKEEKKGERYEVSADVGLKGGKPIIVKKEGMHLPEVLKNLKLAVKEKLGKK